MTEAAADVPERSPFVLTAGSMAENGALKVNNHMQVVGVSNVFAVGDCADVSEPKTAYHAQLHAAVAVTNILNGQIGRELTEYKTGMRTHDQIWM